MAIAFDAAAVGPFNTSSWSHTCSGSDRILFVATQETTGSPITAVKYNGVSLTQVSGTGNETGNSRTMRIWYLFAPDTGANTVLLTGGGAVFDGVSLSYTGANQSGVPDASHFTTDFSGTTYTETITVSANAWAILFCECGSGTPLAGTGSTVRGSAASRFVVFDSNGALSAGSRSMSATESGGGPWGGGIISFIPITTKPPICQDWPNPTLGVSRSWRYQFESGPSLPINFNPPPIPDGRSILFPNPVRRSTYDPNVWNFTNRSPIQFPPPPIPYGTPQQWPNPVRRISYEAWRWSFVQSTPLGLYKPYLPQPSDVIISIAGVVRTTDVDLVSVEIEDNINEAPDICNFKIRGTAPAAGQEIKIGLGTLDAANLIFAGTIITPVQGYDITPTQQVNIVYNCSASDYTYLLNRRLPLGVFNNVSASTVITTLMSGYSSGFTVSGVPAGLPAITIAFDGNNMLAHCITDVCNLIGYHWNVTYSKDIEVYTVRSGTPPATVDISNGTVQAAPQFTYETDLTQIRTRVIGLGPTTTAMLGFISGDTTIPVVDSTVFSSSGGSAIASRASGALSTDIFSYTGKQAGGVTTATTTGDPLAASSLTAAEPSPKVTGKVPVGVIQYKVVFGTPTGQGTGSTSSVTISTVTTSGSGSLTAAFISGGGLTSGTYLYDFTIVTANGESASVSGGSVTVGGGNNAVTVTSPPFSDGRVLRINVYRSKVGGGTEYLVGTITTSSTSWVDTVPDISLGSQVLPSSATPGYNFGAASLTSIPTSGDSRVTSRLIYRTLAGGSVFFLAITIGDNTTTSMVDTIPDSSLGAPFPATSTIAIPVGATSIPITDLAQVPSSGYATIGSITVKYTGRSGSSGAGSLTGVPSSGTGSVTAAISFGTAISVTPTITGVSGVTNTALAGSSIGIRVQVDDVAAQAALALLEGGDGIHEYQFSDTSTTLANLTLEAQTYLNQFGYPIITIKGGIRDRNVNSGKFLTVNLPSPMSITTSLMIQTVKITNIGTEPGQFPLYSPDASSVKFTFQDWMRQLGGLLSSNNGSVG